MERSQSSDGHKSREDPANKQVNTEKTTTPLLYAELGSN